MDYRELEELARSMGLPIEQAAAQLGESSTLAQHRAGVRPNFNAPKDEKTAPQTRQALLARGKEIFEGMKEMTDPADRAKARAELDLIEAQLHAQERAAAEVRTPPLPPPIASQERSGGLPPLPRNTSPIPEK